MKFRVVPAEAMYQEGNFAVSVDWQDDVFREPLRTVQTDGERRERTILMETPERPSEGKKSALPADVLPYLSSDQLRELADLEDARSTGAITEGHYRRERERILEEAREGAEAEDSD
jgi:hypothetical protein